VFLLPDREFLFIIQPVLSSCRFAVFKVCYFSSRQIYRHRINILIAVKLFKNHLVKAEYDSMTGLICHSSPDDLLYSKWKN